MKKMLVIVIGLAFILTGAMVASAQSDLITDPANDVFYWDIGLQAANIATKPNIDIREITYSFQGDTLTLTMRVQGTISAAVNHYYFIELETDDGGQYVVMSALGGASAVCSRDDAGYQDGVASVSGSTITGTLPMASPSTTVTHFSGIGQEYGPAGEFGSEWWIDYAPDSVIPAQYQTPPPGGNGGTTPPGSAPGTPGFELIAVLAALGAAFILIKKRK